MHLFGFIIRVRNLRVCDTSSPTTLDEGIHKISDDNEVRLLNFP